jgi:uncharacterized membrane protein (UPF0127 family)
VLVAVVCLAAVIGMWLAQRRGIPSEFWFSPIEVVRIDGHELRVARVGYAQGLREVVSLGELDGALFVLDTPAPSTAGMGMHDTLMPLDVAFFDARGRFVNRYTMPVCQSDDCPTFYPHREWQFAVEAPAGTLGWITDSVVLTR